MKRCIIMGWLLLILSNWTWAQESTAGFRSFHLVDSTRIYQPHTTPQDSLHFRPVDVDIWYPSEQKNEKPLTFGDLFGLFEQRALKYQVGTNYSGMTRELAQLYVAELGVGTDGQELLGIKTRSYANVQPSGKKHPVILYLAGLNGMSFENYKLLEDLARHGFVVVAIWSVGRYPGNMTNQMDDMLEQVEDAEFALQQLKSGKMVPVDSQSVGILAYSWGGMSGAVLVNRNPGIKAMVSLDGSETHYFGESDIDADGDNTDQLIREIYDSHLLMPQQQQLTYLYFESGDKLNDFTPTSVYSYYDQLPSEKYYLRMKNGTHADFSCIPFILHASKAAVDIYKNIEAATVSFFQTTLQYSDTFSDEWKKLTSLDFTTEQPYAVSQPATRKTAEISGQVTDSQTGEPMRYVNMGLLNRETGTVTDTVGQFHLPVDEKWGDDTLRISCIGYRPVEYRVSDLLGRDMPLQIKMDKQVNELNEVVVIAKAFRRKTLGNKTESRFLSTGFRYDQLGAEMGIRIRIRKPAVAVDAFHFSISYNRLSTPSVFRVNFYDIQNGKPAITY